MSMNYYGINEYGLVLLDSDLEYMASKIVDGYSKEAYAEDKSSFDWEVRENIDIAYISDFDGDVVLIGDNGEDDWYANTNLWFDYGDGTINYIPLDNYPTLFKAAYGSIEEMIEEVKRRVGKWLPENLDYRNRLCHIIGTELA